MSGHEEGACPTCGAVPRIQVGDIIHGFARGWFGRDSYACKRVEKVGPDWIVARAINTHEEGSVYVARGEDVHRELMGCRKPELDGWGEPCCSSEG